jgi:Holliday junction DNA helicase RuvA
VYDFLRGRLVDVGPESIVLENGGIGYRLLVSGATSSRLPTDGEATVFVLDMVRDDRPTLYGFASREERRLFERLLGVSKVGPTTALALLSALEPGVLAAAVNAGDTTQLSRVKGIGKRTAERLCVDLKGRLDDMTALPGAITDARVSVSSALVALGYPRPVAEAAAEAACAEAAPDTPLEELVKLGLASTSKTSGKSPKTTGQAAAGQQG